MLHQDLVVADLAEDQKSAVAQRGDAGQRRVGETVPVRLRARALSPSSFAQRSISAMPIVAVPHRWRICAGLGTDAVKAQQHHQRAEPGIIGFRMVGASVINLGQCNGLVKTKS